MKPIGFVPTSLAALLILSGVGITRAAEPQLGSPDFKVSPEHPIGFRGDWTGRYPGATPPTAWSRVAKTSLRDLRCQGAKPAGDAASGAALPFGRIENWLIVGPFTADDLATGVDKELIPQEADLKPAAGDKAGDNTWALFQAGGDNQHGGAGQSCVEFYRAFHSPAGTVCAYAYTNLFAPTAVKANLGLGIPAAIKVYVNGKAVVTEPKQPYAGHKSVTIDLNQGWNRVLVKVLCTTKKDDAHNLRFVANLSPTDKSFDYESTNISWMTPMPNATTSLPIIVGAKIFTTSQNADLVCLSKADGKILWLRGNSYYDVMTDEEKAATPELKTQVEPEAAKLRDLNAQLIKDINAAVSPNGLPFGADPLAEKFAAKSKLENNIETLLVKNKVTKRISFCQHVGTANGTPCSDGKYVWAIFGGGTYSGPLTVVCYDLDGKRIWARGYSDVAAGEHGTHCSPVVVDGKLVVQTIDTIGVLDAATGKDIWTAKPQGQANNGGGSPICTRLGDTWVIIGPRRDIYRLADGKVLFVPDAQNLGHSLTTPALDQGVIYQTVGWGNSNYSAFQLPDAYADTIKPKQLYRVAVDAEGKYKDYTFTNSFIGSPLYDNGLVYYLTEGGILHVSDSAKGTPAYVRMLDEMRTRVQWVFFNGACASPALAGKYVYLVDDNGITVIIEPGREFKKVAVNPLECYRGGFSQEQILSTPVFEGKYMYLRTPSYLYCIGGK